MKNNVKVLVALAALMVLVGCKPSVDKPVDVDQAGGKTVESNEEAEPTESDEDENEMDSDDTGGTNIGECLRGCDILKGGTGLFSKENCLDSCWAGEAQDTGDISICDNKVDKGNALVQFACRLNVAEKTGDPKYCVGIAADANDLMRVGCVSSVAEKKKDPSICEAIKGSMLYGSCIEDAKGE